MNCNCDRKRGIKCQEAEALWKEVKRVDAEALATPADDPNRWNEYNEAVDLYDAHYRS